MKIGIMTFWWSDDNYGQLLQCYALQKFLKDLGHEVFVIKYREKHKPLYTKILKALNPKKVFKFFTNTIKQRKVIAEQKQFNREFDKFRNRYITWTDRIYNSYDELKRNPPKADVYIVGSDQVWNPTIASTAGDALKAYFLDFGNENIKRWSYAASFGQVQLEQQWIEVITPLLKKFDYVSVREKNGINLCKKCGFDNAEWVCDPTMLLKAEDYRKIYKKNIIRETNDKYLLLYMLGNECDFNIENIYKFAEKENLRVIFITANALLNKKEKFFATIPEWLYLIDNAQFIITNSFHCGVFATIFHKQFGIVALTGKHKGMNVRFDSLFELCGLDMRYVSGNNFDVLYQEYKVNKIVIHEHFFSKL